MSQLWICIILLGFQFHQHRFLQQIAYWLFILEKKYNVLYIENLFTFFSRRTEAKIFACTSESEIKFYITFTPSFIWSWQFKCKSMKFGVETNSVSVLNQTGTDLYKVLKSQMKIYRFAHISFILMHCFPSEPHIIRF